MSGETGNSITLVGQEKQTVLLHPRSSSSKAAAHRCQRVERDPVLTTDLLAHIEVDRRRQDVAGISN
jgi:hypothetical protein